MNVKAYAKINLGLYVVGKRDDGFHNIETIFHRISLFDELSITENDFISVTSSDATLPVNNENLCWKAVELLQKELRTSQGISIHIKKNIPIGAGLGGGSSDAAIILQSVPLLWNKRIEQNALQNLALQLGSDVPYFLNKQSAYAEGRGEKLAYVDFTLPYWIVLVNPGIHVSTPWAYKALSEKRKRTFPVRTSLGNSFSLSPLQSALVSTNDFEEIVFNAYPLIASLKEKMLQLNAVHSLMSGSGSSVFGLFEQESDAKKALHVFDTDYFVHLTEPNFTIV